MFMNNAENILLVEDDPGDVHLALAVLRAMKIDNTCVLAADGEMALDYLLLRGRFAARPVVHPALVLLDLKLPKVNGFEVLQNIKTNEILREIPVIALTSSREDRDIERAYELGANGYVVKGIDFDEYRKSLQVSVDYWININANPNSMGAQKTSMWLGAFSPRFLLPIDYESRSHWFGGLGSVSFR
jgi:CheY-like chemotaxis protein